MWRGPGVFFLRVSILGRDWQTATAVILVAATQNMEIENSAAVGCAVRGPLVAVSQ